MRPSWMCTADGKPWPCYRSRTDMLAQYRGQLVSLAMVMGSAFVECCQDLRNHPAGDLHDRFLGWIRERPRTHDSTVISSTRAE